MTRCPGLNDYDRAGPAWTPTWRLRVVQDPDRVLGEVIAGPGCWCGAEYQHDWPGKAEGAPHPRVMWWPIVS